MTYEDIMQLTVRQLSMLLSKLDLVRPPQLVRPTAQESHFLCAVYLDFRQKKAKGFGPTYIDALAHALVYAWKTRTLPTDWRRFLEPNPFED